MHGRIIEFLLAAENRFVGLEEKLHRTVYSGRSQAGVVMTSIRFQRLVGHDPCYSQSLGDAVMFRKRQFFGRGKILQCSSGNCFLAGPMKHNAGTDQ
jgi:hypothetical protein